MAVQNSSISLLLVVLLLLPSSGAWEFIQVPVSALVQSGEDAIFSCRARATAVYYAINGSKYTPSGIRWTRNLTEDGFYMTLVIPGVNEYNNTRVQCCLNIQSQQAPICSEVAHLVIEAVSDFPGDPPTGSEQPGTIYPEGTITCT